jgi:NADH:ubiquinone oxidoreductase subunit 6 (subunit J)
VLQIVFIVISAITLISAVVVVTNRNLFHAALAMMLSFVGVAGMYVLLDAGFLAAAQLLVYVGAISILIIFAIMLTRRMMQTRESPYNAQWLWGAATSLLVFALFAFVLIGTWAGVDGPPAVSDSVLRGMVTQLGVWFVSPDHYVIPFEVASILLLAALIGSIVIATPEKKS